MTSSGQWSQTQLNYARIIVQTGKNTPGITDRDIQTALMVALDESQLQEYANSSVPDSLSLPHDAVGNDQDSVGLFQQRPSQGWGTVQSDMDPAQSAKEFYDALKNLPPNIRGTMPPWQLAQTIQRSADPTGSNYAKYFDDANQILKIVGGGTGNGAAPAGPNSNLFSWILNADNWKRVGIGALGALFVILALWKWLSATDAFKEIQRTTKSALETAAIA